MNRQFFGTDGVRGKYGGPVINPAFAHRLGVAVARWMKHRAMGENGGGMPHVLIGQGHARIGAGIGRCIGGRVCSRGICLVKPWRRSHAGGLACRADPSGALGAVITASHNPAADNGIKFFGPTGGKLTDAEEVAIEQQLVLVADPDPSQVANVPIQTMGSAADDYVHEASRLLPPASLKGWRIVLDTANGATCGTSPAVFRGLGAAINGIGAAPDGRNINAGVGSENPEQLGTAVLACGARLGIAHDGDGDRCVLCDERGGILDGDEILTLLAVHALRRGTLANNVLVVTVQSKSALTRQSGRPEGGWCARRLAIDM